MVFVVFRKKSNGKPYVVNPQRVHAFFALPESKNEGTRLLLRDGDIDVCESYGEVWEALNGALSC